MSLVNLMLHWNKKAQLYTQYRLKELKNYNQFYFGDQNFINCEFL